MPLLIYRGERFLATEIPVMSRQGKGVLMSPLDIIGGDYVEKIIKFAAKFGRVIQKLA